MRRKNKIRNSDKSPAINQTDVQSLPSKRPSSQQFKQQSEPQSLELQHLLIHELRSPIADISILIKNYFADQIDSPVCQALLGRVEHLFEITESALKHPLPFSDPATWVDPDNLICDLAQNIMATMATKKLKLHYHSELLAGEKIQVNAQALQVLARNILVNAVNYTQRGSIKIKLQRTTKGLRLSIHDSGVGMPLKYKTYLEDRNAEPILSHNGHGIGLVLVHGAVKALNASIAVVRNDPTVANVAESNLNYSTNSTTTGDQQHINSGTCCSIDIPGCWHLGKKALRSSLSADLAQLKNYPELYQRVTELGLYHNPKTALIRLQIQEETPPYLLFTLLSKMQTAIVYLPCSQEKLFTALQSIKQPKETNQMGYHDAKDASLKNAALTNDSRIVLIVDDSEISLNILTQMFKSLQWTVQVAEDRDIANDKLAKMNYDLIVCDSCLPGAVMTTTIPAIAISAVKQIADQLCQSPGNWLGAVQKPIDQQDLINLLKKWQSVKGTSAWDFKFGESRLGVPENVLVLARQVLKDLLASWRPLLIVINKKDKAAVSKLVHKLLGGLCYTGLRRLTEEFEQLRQLASQDKLPSKSNINQLRQVIRQSLVILKHEIAQSSTSAK